MKYIITAIVILLCPFSNALAGNGKDTDSYLKDGVNHLVTRTFSNCFSKKTRLGLKIVSLDGLETLHSINEKSLFIPASNMKLFTTSAALKILNPNYKFKTAIYHDGTINKGIVEGNLYIKGFGDPKLVIEELWLIVRQLKYLGINKINGDIIADDTYFDDKRYGNGWSGSLNSRAYSAGISALSLNFNTVTVYVKPGNKEKENPVVQIDPDTDFVNIENYSSTGARNSKNILSIKRKGSGGKNSIVVKGRVPLGQERKIFYRSITEPTIYTVTVFKDLLKQHGIVVGGDVAAGVVTKDTKEFYLHKSVPLSLVVRDLNKLSNNFIAEQILKTLGAEIKGVPGTFSKGIKVVEDFLGTIGIEKGTYIMADGSGFSRKNRITPAQIVTLLVSMSKDFTVNTEFEASLPVMGMDGSLKDRKNIKNIQSYVRAKTGTLDGVGSLSGYAGNHEGRRYAFSIMINNFSCSVVDIWDFQNRVLELLIKQ